jgi:hypothetical protein
MFPEELRIYYGLGQETLLVAPRSAGSEVVAFQDTPSYFVRLAIQLVGQLDHQTTPFVGQVRNFRML